MSDNKHSVPDHLDEKENKKDHYHNEHHYDNKGNHDDIIDDDFNFKYSIYINKKNLLYRLAAAGVFLALASICTFFDSMLERIFTLPLDGVILSVRYLDIFVITLSIGVLGPVFSSLIAFIVPWIHLLMDAEHGPLPSLIDSLGYFAIIWILWLLYYVIFKNSYIHKDPSKKKDLIKRWVPIAIFIPITLILYVPLTILMIYISNPDHEVEEVKNQILKIVNYHETHEHGHWTDFKEKYVVYTFIVIGFETLRFTVCYSLFAVIEPQMKKLNHIYK
ncbi:ECF transporter S component [Spiroplasma taiwanense]|uniref:Transmembrane protein n=1 Tax=Spiroplasma taiwanense CT-1 TaxID=1276220 RepID=S5MB07_9MOLU|nr:ECF transporter S component [Spiroplasma taiwanense]AGR40953.1 transmembrane protein [Spiroplasma taiwanense CT-1]